MYKIYKNSFDEINQVVRISDNAFIPFDPANTDAVEFARWLQEGGIPEAAEKGEVISQAWITTTIAKLLPTDK